MCNMVIGVLVTVVGAVLVVLSCSISFGLVPNIVHNTIKSEVQLIKGTEQWERFEEVPFPLTFNVRLFNITNPAEVLAGGVPVVNEVGPYVYKCFQSRMIEGVDEDKVDYRRKDYFEFDEEASYPYTAKDTVSIVNLAYHGILQMAESMFPELMIPMNVALAGIFGNHNQPIMTVQVDDLLFGGIPICKTPGFVGGIACGQIRTLSANVRNMELNEDGYLEFTVLRYKHNQLSDLYKTYRGLNDVRNLGLISSFNGSSYLDNWINDVADSGEVRPGVCNMVNGTDSGIFRPFVDRENSLFALNTDICRSAELRYQFDTTYEGIPAARFSANEWFLDNNQGCFCLNVTKGITRDDGCLLQGAMELFSCVGAFMVLSYPHFLYADFRYQNGIVGMSPREEDHRIFVDLELNTGTVLRGMKRAQFNIFMRPITSIPGTQNLRTTLVPALWVEEGISLPDDYVDMLKSRLLQRLNTLDIVIPVVIAISCLIFVLGIIILICVKRSNKVTPVTFENEKSAENNSN